jgi:hypothetical protein
MLDIDQRMSRRGDNDHQVKRIPMAARLLARCLLHDIGCPRNGFGVDSAEAVSWFLFSTRRTRECLPLIRESSRSTAI